jgi:hypothetical protein
MMTIIDVAYLVPIFRNFYASCGQALEYKNISGNRFTIQIIVFVADSLNFLLPLLVRLVTCYAGGVLLNKVGGYKIYYWEVDR